MTLFSIEDLPCTKCLKLSIMRISIKGESSFRLHLRQTKLEFSGSKLVKLDCWVKRRA